MRLGSCFRTLAVILASDVYITLPLCHSGKIESALLVDFWILGSQCGRLMGGRGGQGGGGVVARETFFPQQR